VYVQNEVRSRNQCYRGEAISITHSECVSVALIIQHAKRMHRITRILVIRFVFGSTIFLHIISKTAEFNRKNVIGYQIVCFDFIYNFFLKHFSF
jgi:hypothetical protein